MKTSTICMLSAFLFLGCLATSTNLTAQPIGYERWVNTDVKSGSLFFMQPALLYGTYADKLNLVSGSRPKASRRLIDIEINTIGGKNSFDVVWVENKGNMKSNSWFLHDLSVEDVHLLAALPNAVILDIERYGSYYTDHNLKDARYAVILQDNPKEYKTKVFTQALWAEIAPYALDRENWRPVDMDVLQWAWEYFKYPRAYDTELNRFDVVFVENQTSSTNYVETIWIAGEELDIVNYAVAGFQLVDIEDSLDHYTNYFPDSRWHMIFVKPGQSFFYIWGMSENELLANLNGLQYYKDVEKYYGRCVDLEGHPFNPNSFPRGREAVFVPN